MFDLTNRFSIGINIDDSWRYAGAKAPKSIIIPHLLSIDLPIGKVIDKISELEHQKHEHHNLKGKVCSACYGAIVALADKLNDAKISFVRCWFPWRFFEPEISSEPDKLLEDGYEEWPMDDFVSILTNHNIGIVPVVACGYHRMLPRGLDVDLRDDYIKRASIHTRLLVRRYKDKIKFWQIENEPNWWRMHYVGGWRKGFSWIDPHEFTENLLKALNNAVYLEDQKAKTIINLEADARNLDANLFAKFCDILGLDFYPNYKSSSPIDTSIFKKAKEVTRETGKPLIISETGYPSGPFFLGYTESKQKEYVTRACSEAFGIDEFNGIGLWRYIDGPWRSFPFQENHFGLINSRGNSKPAWYTLTESVRKMS